jgi:hypothetical protein
MTKKITILSIDGSGIRGILPGVILSNIEHQLNTKEGLHARLSNCFDLMGATITGKNSTFMYELQTKITASHWSGFAIHPLLCGPEMRPANQH